MVGRIARGPVIVAFATIYAIWGPTYLALALALQSLPPFLLVGARSVAAGLILLGIERSRSGALPPAGAWMPAALGGLLLFVGCHGSLAYAQQYVPSGLAAVMIATVPFWFVLLNFFSWVLLMLFTPLVDFARRSSRALTSAVRR